MKKRKKSNPHVFSEYYGFNKLKKDIRNNGLLLSFVCLCLSLFFYVQAVCSTGVKEMLFISLTVVFILILLLFWLFPSVLFGWLHRIQSVTNHIGRWIITVILIPVFLLLCFVSLPFIRNVKKKSSFCRWTDDEKPVEKTFFINDDKNVFHKGSSGIIDFLIELISTTTRHRNFFLFPILVILLFIGLLFYFISSSAVIGFLYTLF